VSRRARLVPILLCALAPLAAASAAADTGAERRSKPEPRSLAFFLEGSGGYEIALLTAGDRVAIAPSRRRVASLYEVAGRVSDTRIEARFGRLGRVSGRYERVGLLGEEPRPDRDGCEDPFSFVRFVGTISFRGEDGYTAIEERRVGGYLRDPAARRCRQRARASVVRRRHLNTQLVAASKRGGVTTFVSVRRLSGDPRAGLEASREERRDGMFVFRQAETTIGGDNALIASGPGVQPPFAFVAPPKPFGGTAVFDPTAPWGSAWTGSLTAWFPGLGRTPLTGPEYALAFCRRAGDEPGCGTEPLVRRSLSALQGSGSQSQLLADARLSWSR
jgi:hypothetical protein